MEEEITKAVKALEAGKTILYPTDTVWGIGCDVGNEAAIEKVLQVKEAKEGKSLIVLVADMEQLRKYVSKIPDLAWELLEYAERPITIVYPGGKNVAPSILGEDGSIAIRVVKNPFCVKLIQKAGFAITSTSANISGFPAPQSFLEIDAVVKERVDHIVNWKQNEKGAVKPSTIVKIGFNGEVKFLRR